MEVSPQTNPRQRETIADAQRSIVESFRYLENWSERYHYIIEQGRRLPPFPETKRIEANRLRGCRAGVWLVADYRNGRLEFEAASDSAIVAGLIALLLKVYSGRHPDQVLAISPVFIDETGLGDHLSLQRTSGLSLILARIRALAIAHLQSKLTRTGA